MKKQRSGWSSALAPLSSPRASLVLALVLTTLVMQGCATLTGTDPGARTAGTIIDDQMIETLAKRRIFAEPGFETAHIAVVSLNGHILLVGQVASENLKRQAQRTVERLANVESVHNELTVGGSTSMVARTNDAWLTTKVKTKLITHDGVDGDRIKVVTEDGVVYLMGRVPRREAELAVQATGGVFGVQKIVKVFQYLE